MMQITIPNFQSDFQLRIGGHVKMHVLNGKWITV